MTAELKAAALRALFLANERLNRSPLGGAWRGAKRAALRALKSLHGVRVDGEGAVLSVEGSRMFLPAKYLEWYARGYERLTLERFKSSLRPGAVVVDVGAHVGTYALAAARLVGPSGAVFAFEPAAENFAVLLENVRLNGYANVTARQAAAGARTQTRTLNIAASSDSNSFYGHPLAAMTEARPVECVALDDALAGRAIDVVKIDVEGAEPEVLAGMAKLARANPGLALFVEFNPCCLRLGGHEPRELLRLLSEWGFSMTLLDERAGTATPIAAASPFPADDRLFHANLHCVRAGGA